MSEAALGLSVSRETEAGLRAFAALAAQWNPRINLIAKREIDDLWFRHIVDSAQLFPLAPADPGLTWADFGSGGGFPGIVLAILRQGRGDRGPMVLVESDQRKAVFLREAARHLGLALQIHAARIETLPPLNAHVATARALAPLDRLLPLIARHLRQDGVAILPKGRRAAEEIAVARNDWAFDLDEVPSITDPQARILLFTHLARATRD